MFLVPRTRIVNVFEYTCKKYITTKMCRVPYGKLTKHLFPYAELKQNKDRSDIYKNVIFK